MARRGKEPVEFGDGVLTCRGTFQKFFEQNELKRKESFLHSDHPLGAKFARLTAQEEKDGLLEDPSGIGTRDGWSRRLVEMGFALRGHRVVRSSQGDGNGASIPPAF